MVVVWEGVPQYSTCRPYHKGTRGAVIIFNEGPLYQSSAVHPPPYREQLSLNPVLNTTLISSHSHALVGPLSLYIKDNAKKKKERRREREPRLGRLPAYLIGFNNTQATVRLTRIGNAWKTV